MSRWSVAYTDGSTAEVKTTVGDIVAFEKANGRLLDSKSLSDISWLVWRAATRLGQTGDEFQVWADKVDDYDPVADAPLAPPVPPS